MHDFMSPACEYDGSQRKSVRGVVLEFNLVDDWERRFGGYCELILDLVTGSVNHHEYAGCNGCCVLRECGWAVSQLRKGCGG